jgi:hypothetical protein
MMIALNHRIWFWNNYTGPASGQVKELLRQLLITANGTMRNWPLKGDVDRFRNKIREIWNNFQQHTPVGSGSDVGNILHWLIPENLGWSTVTCFPKLKCSNTDCKQEHASLASTSSYFFEILYPSQSISLLEIMRQPPMVSIFDDDC